jgi:NAD(P)-dependent dehydrogenase (short-subunit alcohol dehydrogenase family)
VNTSSLTGAVGMPGIPLYSTSKAAVTGLTRALAADLLPDGIRVNCVSPAHVDTPWIQRMIGESEEPEVALRLARARQPTGELVSVDEVARAILYLAHPQNSSITAVELFVDGGAAGIRQAPQ